MPLPSKYEVDPADPRAPSVEVWHSLSRSEQNRIVEQLPSEVELGPPEGDPHRIPKQRGIEALDAFFRRAGRRVYLSSELPVYYPAERMFAPDLIAVCDVEPHERLRWVVTHEGRGLDFALEVTLSGSRKKDLEENVARFARLGIPEYFVFDRAQRRIFGWQLVAPGRPYEPIVPQQGRWRSGVLGLDLAVEGDRFRFYWGTAVVPELAELVARANSLVDELQDKLEHLDEQFAREQQRAEQEQQRAEQERQRAEQAEAELERLRAELERLRRERQ
ncbi:MAG TPA: Uma2 family endonuclease [Polyangiaceae bacterium]|nr:Uma2 family endonuclease [Polyangiaceae bacterium]